MSNMGNLPCRCLTTRTYLPGYDSRDSLIGGQLQVIADHRLEGHHD